MTIDPQSTNTSDSAEEQQKNRPITLTRVCTLSFIGSGFSVFGGILLTLFYNSILDFLILNESEDSQLLFDTMSELSREYLAINCLLSIGSLIGVFFMWNLKKAGFHIYTISNILMLGLPLFFGIGTFDLQGLIFISGPFILFYAIHLKFMS
jgi:ABC-type Fe3+-siderophore transport system permease subunit